MKYKNTFMAYAAWDYESELETLDRASEQGWQLVKGGCFHSRYVYNTDIRYRYQMDFRKVDDLGRYIEIFREQGWEYVNSTFNNWHIFRKLYDPGLPDEAYEIFTDRESVMEMRGNWARVALAIACLTGAGALISAVRMVTKPHIPALAVMLLFLIESVFLFRGWYIMRHPEDGRKEWRYLFPAFVLVILIGCTANIVLTEQRPYFETQQCADDVLDPIVDNGWLDFDVKYKDSYYLDLQMDADAPITFRVIDDNGDLVYSRTADHFQEDNIRLRLEKGQYHFSMNASTGFDVRVSMD